MIPLPRPLVLLSACALAAAFFAFAVWRAREGDGHLAAFNALFGLWWTLVALGNDDTEAGA